MHGIPFCLAIDLICSYICMLSSTKSTSIMVILGAALDSDELVGCDVIGETLVVGGTVG